MLLGSPAYRTAYPFIIRAKASDMHLGLLQHRKQRNHEKVGCMNSWVSGAEAVDSGSSFLFVKTGVHQRKRGYTWKGKGICRGRWKDMRNLLWFIYILLSQLLVGYLFSESERKCTGKWGHLGYFNSWRFS